MSKWPLWLEDLTNYEEMYSRHKKLWFKKAKWILEYLWKHGPSIIDQIESDNFSPGMHDLFIESFPKVSVASFRRLLNEMCDENLIYKEKDCPSNYVFFERLYTGEPRTWNKYTATVSELPDGWPKSNKGGRDSSNKPG